MGTSSSFGVYGHNEQRGGGGMARTPFSSPFHAGSNRLELTDTKLLDLGLWLPPPAQLGVECNWPEPGLVAKHFFFPSSGQPDFFVFLFLNG